MIKCEVSICANITRNAIVKSGKDNQQFVTFGVSLPLKGRNGEQKNLEISVTCDGDKGTAASYTTGRRVNILGNLIPRKKGGKVFFNLRADGGIEFAKSTADDKIEGTMEFKGKIGKKGVDCKTDRKGEPYKAFSAFSSDKDGDNVEFVWVRFLYFHPKDGEDFLQAGSYISAKGDRQLGVFKDDISLDCRVSEVSHWEINK